MSPSVIAPPLYEDKTTCPWAEKSGERSLEFAPCDFNQINFFFANTHQNYDMWGVNDQSLLNLTGRFKIEMY